MRAVVVAPLPDDMPLAVNVGRIALRRTAQGNDRAKDADVL
jgi:hypothetical protein